MIRHFVGRALEEAGYEVVVLSPPSGAVDLLAEAPFDLVITNSIMPAASGAELVARIRSEFPSQLCAAGSPIVQGVGDLMYSQ